MFQFIRNIFSALNIFSFCLVAIANLHLLAFELLASAIKWCSGPTATKWFNSFISSMQEEMNKPDQPMSSGLLHNKEDLSKALEEVLDDSKVIEFPKNK